MANALLYISICVLILTAGLIVFGLGQELLSVKWFPVYGSLIAVCLLDLFAMHLFRKFLQDYSKQFKFLIFFLSLFVFRNIIFFFETYYSRGYYEFPEGSMFVLFMSSLIGIVVLSTLFARNEEKPKGVVRPANPRKELLKILFHNNSIYRFAVAVGFVFPGIYFVVDYAMVLFSEEARILYLGEEVQVSFTNFKRVFLPPENVMRLISKGFFWYLALSPLAFVGTTWKSKLKVATIAFVFGSSLLIAPFPGITDELRWVHFIETGAISLLTGLSFALLFCRSSESRASDLSP